VVGPLSLLGLGILLGSVMRLRSYRTMAACANAHRFCPPHQQPLRSFNPSTAGSRSLVRGVARGGGEFGAAFGELRGGEAIASFAGAAT